MHWQWVLRINLINIRSNFYSLDTVPEFFRFFKAEFDIFKQSFNIMK